MTRGQILYLVIETSLYTRGSAAFQPVQENSKISYVIIFTARLKYYLRRHVAINVYCILLDVMFAPVYQLRSSRRFRNMDSARLPFSPSLTTASVDHCDYLSYTAAQLHDDSPCALFSAEQLSWSRSARSPSRTQPIRITRRQYYYRVAGII